MLAEASERSGRKGIFPVEADVSASASARWSCLQAGSVFYAGDVESWTRHGGLAGGIELSKRKTLCTGVRSLAGIQRNKGDRNIVIRFEAGCGADGMVEEPRRAFVHHDPGCSSSTGSVQRGAGRHCDVRHWTDIMAVVLYCMHGRAWLWFRDGAELKRVLPNCAEEAGQTETEGPGGWTIRLRWKPARIRDSREKLLCTCAGGLF